MKAACSQVEVTPEGGELRVRFRVTNLSAQAWRVSEGFRIGTQFFDPDTHAYIEEGPRVAPSTDVAAGEASEVDVRLFLPEQNGRYHVYVSPMSEKDGW